MWVCSHPTLLWSTLHLSILLKWIGTCLRSLHFTCLCLYAIRTFPVPLTLHPASRRCLFHTPQCLLQFQPSAKLLLVQSSLFHPFFAFAFPFTSFPCHCKRICHAPHLDAAFRHCFTSLPLFENHCPSAETAALPCSGLGSAGGHTTQNILTA